MRSQSSLLEPKGELSICGKIGEHKVIKWDQIIFKNRFNYFIQVLFELA